MTRKELKTKAKENLSGNWGKSIGVIVVYFLMIQLGLIFDVAIGGGTIGSNFFENLWILFAMGALTLGLCIYNISLSKGNGKFAQLFEGFKIYPKSLGAWILRLLIGLVSGIGIFILTMISLLGFVSSFINYSFSTSIFGGFGVTISIIGVIVAIILIVIGIILSYMYSQVFFILAENPDKRVIEAFKESKLIMKNNKFRYFVLQLSFIWWYLLGGVTMGLAFIWIAPYISQTMAMFYFDIKKKEVKNEISVEERILAQDDIIIVDDTVLDMDATNEFKIDLTKDEE